MSETDKSLPDVVRELWELLRDYASQETVDPLKGLGRYLGWGLLGTFCLSIGLVFLTLGLLRVLQTETGDVFDDMFSWAPYVITFAFVCVVAFVAFTRIGREPKRPA